MGSKEYIEPRNKSVDLWKDIQTYSSNLAGNWMLSKHIFYFCIVPTAEKNPEMFAKWIKEMVDKSGVKIKAKSEFIEGINYLTNNSGKKNRSGIRRALYHLFRSGLEESIYASRALQNKYTRQTA